MSSSNVEDRADAVTDDGFEDETNYSDVDESSGVPPCLVSDSACLSQYHSRSPAQAYFPDLYRRLYLANIHNLKEQETKNRQRRQRPERDRKRQKTDTPKGARRSLNDDFVDFLLPQLLQKEGETRRDAKQRFENWMPLGRTCSKLVKEFGAGIFLRLPDIPDETYGGTAGIFYPLILPRGAPLT